MNTPTETKYPDAYLHVEHCHSGETWIVPIQDGEPLDLTRNVEAWAKNQFGGELELDGKIMPKLSGDYYAKVMCDGRPPDSVACWQAGGFYLKSTYE